MKPYYYVYNYQSGAQAEAEYSQMTPEKAMQIADDFCKHEAWGLDFWREPMTVLAAEVARLNQERAANLEAMQHTVSADKNLLPDDRHVLRCLTPQTPMTKPTTKHILRDATDIKNSRCYSSELACLDWKNLWQDDGYMHVRLWTFEEGETWHRVYPKRIAGRTVARIAVINGRPHWIYDRKKTPDND